MMKKQRVIIMMFFMIVFILLGTYSNAAETVPIQPSICTGWSMLQFLKQPLTNTAIDKQVLDKLINARWNDPWVVADSDKGQKKNVKNCGECLNYREMQPKVSANDFCVYMSILGDCMALNTFAAGKPSNVSFIGSVKWDEYFIDLLPYWLEHFYFHKTIDKNRNMTFREDDMMVFDKKTNESIFFKGYIFYTNLERIGYADFNNDGIEDLLFSISFGAIQGHSDCGKILVICTKLSESARIVIIKEMSVSSEKNDIEFNLKI